MFSTTPAKSCPTCGGLLRYEDIRGDFPVMRYLASELAYWAAIALVFAYLYAPAGGGSLYLLLAACAVAVWMLLRPLQRASGRALLARRRYVCAQCRRRYEGGGLNKELPSH